MKRVLLLLLFLTATASAQFAPFAFWKTTASGYTFKPTDITSGTIKLWLYADTLKTLESKSAGDTLYRWRDISGNAYHLVNLTASLKPILVDSATVWGAPGASVQFDGVDDYLTRAGAIVDTTTGFTAFTVTRMIAFNVVYQGLWALHESNYNVCALLFSNQANYKDISLGYGSEGNSTGRRSIYTTYSWTVTHVLTVYSAQAMRQTAGARSDSVALTQAGGGDYPAATNQTYIGGYSVANQTYNGHIMEHIVYAGVLPIGDIRKVEEYLKRKYGL